MDFISTATLIRLVSGTIHIHACLNHIIAPRLVHA